MFWNKSPGQSEYDWGIDAYQTLKSTLAFVLWEFSANNFGDPQLSAPNSPYPNGEVTFLPAEFHTSASACKPFTHIAVDRRMFGLYIALQSLPIIFCWMVLLWRIWNGFSKGQISSFPLIDFFFKAQLAGSGITDIKALTDWKDGQIMDALDGVELVSTDGPLSDENSCSPASREGGYQTRSKDQQQS